MSVPEKKNKQKLDSASVTVKDMLAGLTTEDITSKKAGIRAMTVKENKNKKLLAMITLKANNFVVNPNQN